MTSYCSLADLKRYLGISALGGDDALLQSLLVVASSRLDRLTNRTFFAPTETTRTYSASDVWGNSLYLDDDLSHIASVKIDGDDVTADIVGYPLNASVKYLLAFAPNARRGWGDVIEVSGRFAYMESINAFAIARVSGVVTATVPTADVSQGAQIIAVGFSDASFNGVFEITAIAPMAVSWAQTGQPDATATGGRLLYAPPDVIHACRRLAAWMYRQKDNSLGDNDRPIITGDGVTLMPSATPQDVVQAMRHYEKLSNYE